MEGFVPAAAGMRSTHSKVAPRPHMNSYDAMCWSQISTCRECRMLRTGKLLCQVDMCKGLLTRSLLQMRMMSLERTTNVLESWQARQLGQEIPKACKPTQ